MTHSPQKLGLTYYVNHRPLAFTILSAYIIIYSIVTYGGLLEGKALLWWSDMAWSLISLAAGLKCLHTASLQRRIEARRAWIALGCAALFWFVGMLIWDYLELVRAVVTPYPSLADYFFLALGPAFVVGVFYYRAGMPSRYVTLVHVGNMGIILCTIIIVTTVILYPQIQSTEQPYVYTYFAIAYAVVMMSSFVFTLFSYWLYRWSKNRKVLLILLVSIFLHASTDTLYVFELLGRAYGASHSLNVAWILAFALQYWASLEQDTLDKKFANTDEVFSKEVQPLEGITPSLSIIAIIGTLWAFGESLDRDFIIFLISISVMLVLFLVIQEWSLSRALSLGHSKLEEKVRLRTRELSNANQELEAYSYSIAHDLRTPLRSITGFSQMLMEDARDKLTEEEKNLLSRISDSGIYMAQLIDEILELSRIGRIDMKREIVDLSAISRKMLQQMCEIESERNIVWSVADGLKVHGDARLLTLVLQNLLDNAVKYTTDRIPARINIGVEHSQGEAVYFVQDNGAGFDMKYADKLFKSFQRLHRQDDFPGSGVGLAIVSRIIERHGGRIWAEAVPDQGARFYFTIPKS